MAQSGRGALFQGAQAALATRQQIFASLWSTVLEHSLRGGQQPLAVLAVPVGLKFDQTVAHTLLPSTAQERREQLRRATESRNNDLLRLHGGHKNLAVSSASLDRTEDLFRVREARERDAEAALLAKCEANRAARVARERAALQAQLLANELDKRQREQERQTRHVQRVIEESPEIRELRSKLAAAETNYVRERQRKEAADAVTAAVPEDKEFAQSAAAARQAAQAKADESARERRAFELSRRKVLQDQMYERAQAAWAAKSEVAADKVAMDALAASAAADAEAEAIARQLRRQQEAAWVRDFLVEREELAAAKVAAEEEEDARVAAYQKALADRQAGVHAKKQARLDEEARVFAKLAADAAAAQRAREHMEELIARLHFEEEEEKLREQDAARRAKAAAAKAKMLQAYEASIAAKAAREAQAKAEAAAFREHLLAKLAEQDRLEQMADARRRMKVLEHKREVERLAAIKAAMIAEEAALESAREATFMRQQASNASIVETERRRMLAEHAARLVAYLPKGVAATADDLALIYSISGTKAE